MFRTQEFSILICVFVLPDQNVQSTGSQWESSTTLTFIRSLQKQRQTRENKRKSWPTHLPLCNGTWWTKTLSVFSFWNCLKLVIGFLMKILYSVWNKFGPFNFARDVSSVFSNGFFKISVFLFSANKDVFPSGTLTECVYNPVLKSSAYW